MKPTEATRHTSATGGQKEIKLAHHGLLYGAFLTLLAQVCGWGAGKYAPRNWERGYEWSASYSALQRHLTAWWGREEIDPESGLSHLGHAAWHCMVLFAFSRHYPEFDDRSTLGQETSRRVQEF